MSGTEAQGRQRVDKWLFFARVAKSRSLAQGFVAEGRVRVNRDKISQSSHPVKAGDVLTITLERAVLVLRVLAPGTRRGPAPEARLLYEDLTPPPTPKEAVAKPFEEREAGSGRPTKRNRREIEKLKTLL